MNTDKKFARQASKRSATGLPVTIEQANEQDLQCASDIADDYDFLAPHELTLSTIGLLFCLATKRLINLSFSCLYERSQKKTWIDLFVRERRILKPNVNSIEKCFMLNRLIAAYTQSPMEFIQETTKIYEEIKKCMSSTVTSFSTVENLYNDIETYQNLLCQRRLFHINADQTKPSQTILNLQGAMTKVCSAFIKCCETDSSYLTTIEGREHFKKLLQHSIIIVAQPYTPECLAVTKYDKYGNTYIAKLYSRIICLLDVEQIQNHFIFSNIGVTLYSLDHPVDEEGEIQAGLEWKIRTVIDAKGQPKLFYYTELRAIKLTKSDLRSSRPFHSSKLCQLEFKLKVKLKDFDIEEDFTVLSRPFGLCSHAQYFPEYVAKTLIYEIEQIPHITNKIIQPEIITDFICRYHTRITGVEPKLHTRQFIFQESRTVYMAKKTYPNFRSVDIYEELLAKLINQIEFFVDHPFLSMMYYDNLFLGICNRKIDNEMNGTPEQLHILLRFDALATHQSSQQASVRYIVHDGQLIKATFHTKAFVDEMCQMICESISEKAKTSRIFSEMPNRSFHDFSLYFDNELYRLSAISPSKKESYKPLIPVLWSTMRATNDNHGRQLLTSNVESSKVSISHMDEGQSRLLNKTGIIEVPTIVNEKVALQMEQFIQYLAEQLPEQFIKIEVDDTTSTSESRSSIISTNEFIKQKKIILSSLLRDYLQTRFEVQASTQINDTKPDIKPYSSFCSTSNNV